LEISPDIVGAVGLLKTLARIAATIPESQQADGLLRLIDLIVEYSVVIYQTSAHVGFAVSLAIDERVAL